MLKKYRMLLLSILLVFGIIDSGGLMNFGLKPNLAQAAGTTAAQYLGDNRVTQGNWIGVYGKDGYVLPYYKANVASGRDAAIPGNSAIGDLTKMPAYVSGYTQAYSAYWVNANPSSDPRSLQSPDSNYARKNIKVYSGSFFQYSFNITDSNEHTFTVYTTDFGSTESNTEKFEILDPSGNVMDSQNVSVINNGVYLSYKITGSFTIKATKLTGSAFMEGFFFDAPPSVTPVITTQPQNTTVLVDQTATFSVAATGTPTLTYQWQKNGIDIAGATAASYTTPPTTETDSGAAFRVIVSNSTGSVVSNPATLTINMIAQYWGNDRETQGNWVGVYGSDGYILPYYKANAASGRDAAIPGNSTNGDLVKLPAYVSGYTQYLSAYWVNANPSSDPRSLQSPDSNYARKNMIVYSGTNVKYTFNISDNNVHTFTVYTTDFGSTESNTEKFEILDPSGNVIDSRNVSVINNGVYISYKIKGSFSIRATVVTGIRAFMEGFFFDAPPSDTPIITTQPQNATVTAGQMATFTVTATGAPTLTYQWQKNGIDIAGAAAASYTTPPTTESDSGTAFRVVVSNSAGRVISNPATLTINTTQPQTTTAQYLGDNRETQGNWFGVYGSDGYVLPYYKANAASGRDAAIPGNSVIGDLAKLPAYVFGYTQSVSAYWVNANPSSDVRALQSPDSNYARKNMIVYSGTNLKYTFNISDNNAHMFTIYTTDFGNTEINTEKFEILDLQGNVLDSRQVSIINNGVYVSFEVKGSFTIRATKTSGSNAYVEGFFFDAMPQNTISNTTLSYVAPRSVKIDWSNANAGNKTNLLRKKSGEAQYSEIAVVNENVTTYTDQNLEAGVTYFYKLSSISNLKYSDFTSEYQIATPAYKATILEFLDSQLTAGKPGETVKIRARLKDSDGNLMAGRQLNFELQGQYVGTYIDKTIGSGTTDANGEITLDYTPQFEGDYSIKGSFLADDANLINAAQRTIALKVNREGWTKPPVIIRVSDAVKPDTLISINGYALNSSDMSQIAAKAKLSDGHHLSQPPEDAITLPIEQTDVQNGNFLVARLPVSATPGVYDLWVKNEYGWSAPVQINTARPLFISEFQVFEGLDIEMSGRNFAAAEFGAVSNTIVRLNNGFGGTYTAAVKELTPYSVKFAIHNIPLGDYWVEVTNDGGTNWVRLENGQKLSVVAAGADPLGLGAAWAKDFKWDQVYNVKDYGAVPDDLQDDTASVASAIAAAKGNGGGVVYFPNGRYDLSKIDLPADIVLLGETEESTFLYYNGTTGATFIQSSGDGKTAGRQGVARLSIRLSNDNFRPDTFLWLGQDWGNGSNNDMTKRTAEKIFILQVNLDYNLTARGSSGRGIGAIVLAKERVIFDKNRLKGWNANLNRALVNSYLSIRDNFFEYSEGYVVTVASYTIVKNNHIIAHPESLAETHGIFARSNVLMANNIVEGTGPDSNKWNDGEALAVEMPGGVFNVGTVLGAASNDITVAPVQALTDYVISWGYLTVVIIDGRGLGQTRRVVSRQNNKLIIDKPWDIIPDGSSKFTLVSLNDNVTFYKNTIINSANGIYFYGNIMDGVAADNININSQGIYVYSSEVLSTQRFTPAYFVSVKGNSITGVSRRDQHASIAVSSQRGGTGGKYYAVGAYGVDIKDNTITGDLSVVLAPPTVPPASKPPYNGIVSSAAFYSSEAITDGKAGDTTDLVIENNSLKDTGNGGIVLTKGDYGHTLKGNRFTNVGAQNVNYVNGLSIHIVEAQGTYTDNRPPFFPAGSTLTATESGDAGIKLDWKPAVDIFDVTGYKVYQNHVLLGTTAASEHSYTAADLKPGTLYTFTVEAFDSSGNSSADPLSTTIVTKPTVVYSATEPTNVDVTATITPSDWITVTNSSTSHTFSENGSFTFEFVDATGKTGTVTATVTKIDKVPPITMIDVTPVQVDGLNGWYVHPVVFSLNATDIWSGVAKTEYSFDGGNTWQAYASPVTLNQDGKYVLNYRSTDIAGNVETANTVHLNLDATAPVISVSVPTASSYTDGGDLSPQFTVTDNLSGEDQSKTIATLDGQNVTQGTTIALYTLPLGSHTFAAATSDLAGNTQSTTVTFQTYANLDSLKALTTRFASSNWINNAGIANSLQKKLDHGDVGEFIHEVKAQNGKHITSEAANYLLRDALAIIDSLKVMINQFTNNKLIDRADVAKDLLKALDKGDLKDFAQKVQKESGKHISSDAAISLLQGLQFLLKDKK